MIGALLFLSVLLFISCIVFLGVLLYGSWQETKGYSRLAVLLMEDIEEKVNE